MKDKIDEWLDKHQPKQKKQQFDGRPVVFAALSHTWPVASPKDENDEDNDHNEEDENIVDKFIKKHTQKGENK